MTASDDLDQVHKGNYPRDVPEAQRKINDYQLSEGENKKIGDFLKKVNMRKFLKRLNIKIIK